MIRPETIAALALIVLFQLAFVLAHTDVGRHRCSWSSELAARILLPLALMWEVHRVRS